MFLVGFYRFLVGFDRFLVGFYRLLVGFYRFLVGFYRFLVGFYRFLVGFLVAFLVIFQCERHIIRKSIGCAVKKCCYFVLCTRLMLSLLDKKNSGDV